MGEKYMKESDIYRCFYDFWEKHKSIGECLDMVPKYSLEELIQKAADGEGKKSDIFDFLKAHRRLDLWGN